MHKIMSYLKDGALPEDKKRGNEKLRVRAAKYMLQDDILFRWGLYFPCLDVQVMMMQHM